MCIFHQLIESGWIAICRGSDDPPESYQTNGELISWFGDSATNEARVVLSAHHCHTPLDVSLVRHNSLAMCEIRKRQSGDLLQG